MSVNKRMEAIVIEAQSEFSYDDQRAFKQDFLSFRPQEKIIITKLTKLFRERFDIGKGRAIATAALLCLRELEKERGSDKLESHE